MEELRAFWNDGFLFRGGGEKNENRKQETQNKKHKTETGNVKQKAGGRNDGTACQKICKKLR